MACAENVKKLRANLEGLVGKKIDLDIKEIKAPDIDAFLVAKNIANQLERRISYQRAMKRAIQQSMRQGAQGIRIEVAGRLSGSARFTCAKDRFLVRHCAQISILLELKL